MIAFAYGPALDSRLLPVDDQVVLFAPQITAPLSLRQLRTIFTPGAHVDFYPIRDLSYVFDFLFFGKNAHAFRLHQVFLLGEISILLFLILTSIEIPAWFALGIAAIWALHPVHAEMTMWIAARKDLLALVYGCYSVLAFLWARKRDSWSLYAIAVMAFVLGVLSKTSILPLPLLAVIALLLGDQKLYRRKAIIAICVGMGVSLAAGLFTGWFYSDVNDMRALYSWDYRIRASAIALARMTGGWFNPNLNVVDLLNGGRWAEDQYPWMISGAALWLLALGSLGLAAMRRSKALVWTLSGAILLYLPISGLGFPHRNFYSVRYLEPCFLLTALGSGLFIGEYAKKLAPRSARRVVVILGGIALACFLATAQEAKVWSDPLYVMQKSARLRPESPATRSYEYLELANWVVGSAEGASRYEKEKSVLLEKLEKLCDPSDPQADIGCTPFWMVHLAELPANEQLAKNQLLRASLRFYQGPSAAAERARAIAFDDIRRGVLSADEIRDWQSRSHWLIKPELRLLDWAMLCFAEGPASARARLKVFLDADLLTNDQMQTFAQTNAHERYRAQLGACSAESEPGVR